MELIKNLLKYFIVLVCILVGGISIMAGVLFIFPKFRFSEHEKLHDRKQVLCLTIKIPKQTLSLFFTQLYNIIR